MNQSAKNTDDKTYPINGFFEVDLCVKF